MTSNPKYNPGVPFPKDSLAKSQVDFLNNFSTLYTAFMKNHIALDASSGAGNHTIIQLLEQAPNIQFQTDVGEISVYCRKVVGQTDEIFLRYQKNQTEFQLTTYQIYSLGGTQYFSFLPGGVILYFGRLAVTLSTPKAGDTPFAFKLTPAIAKNIISINFSSGNNIASYSPWVTLQNPVSGVYNTINIFQANGTIAPNPNVLFYFIMANT